MWNYVSAIFMKLYVYVGVFSVLFLSWFCHGSISNQKQFCCKIPISDILPIFFQWYSCLAYGSSFTEPGRSPGLGSTIEPARTIDADGLAALTIGLAQQLSGKSTHIILDACVPYPRTIPPRDNPPPSISKPHHRSPPPHGHRPSHH